MSLVDRFKNGDIVINCNTEGQVAALFDWCEENEIIVENQTKEYSFSQCRETVCYRCGAISHQLFYANFNYYKNKGYTIIRYLDFFEKNTNTIKIKDIAEKYAEYEIDAETLKELLIKPKQKTIWELEVGDVYSYIDSDGTIVPSVWKNDIYDKNRRAAGNCFLTKEDAEHKSERNKIETELLELGGRRNFKLYEPNHILIYNHVANVITSVNQTQIDMGGIYFDTQEECVNARWTIGHKRLEKYWFNID